MTYIFASAFRFGAYLLVERDGTASAPWIWIMLHKFILVCNQSVSGTSYGS